jgi:acetyl-CoA C-acetyltransferase
VESGLHDCVMVLGFQKMSEISSAESQERMGRGADIQWESPFGTMMPAYYAMHAKDYLNYFGVTEEDLALIRVKAATYGQKKGRFQEGRWTLSSAWRPDPVSKPLKVFDCCANADGSSAIIVASEKRSRTWEIEKPVWILGVGAASHPVNMAGRDQVHGLRVAEAAAQAGLCNGGSQTPRTSTWPRCTIASPSPR